MKIVNAPKKVFQPKMEKIALKFLSFNKRGVDNSSKLSKDLNNNIMKNVSDDLYKKETKKDSLTIEYLEIKSRNKKSIEKENFINNFTNYFSITSSDKLTEIEKSKIPKEQKIVPKIKGLEKIAQNYIDKLNKKEKEESSSSNIIDNTSQSLLADINYEILNKVYLIYEELKKEFDNIHNINTYSKEYYIHNIEDEKMLRNCYFKCIVLGRDYFKVFLFGEEIQKIIKAFNYSLELGKFIIYQIYLFLSFIYLEENNNLESSTEMSYRTLILYSSQNFKTILKLVKNPQLRAEPKIMKGIKAKNKIIISILKLIYPNIASNEKIKKFIEEDNVDYFCVKYMEEIWKNKKEVNRENDISKPKYNSLGIIHLIILLKQNKELSEKLIEIQKKVLLIALSNYDTNKNNYKYLNQGRNSNNINNKCPLDTNYITESFSSTNKIISNNKDNKNLIEKSSSSNNNLNPDKNNNPINFSITNNKYILPIINSESTNYKYFIFFELDETLVHYFEENNDSFVKIRWGVEDCFSQISDFCEISLISTSSQEYTEKIMEKLNRNKKYVSNIIYKEDEDDNLNLSLINRDMNKCIYVCHEEEFFNAPKNNILTLTEFEGDESDREMLFLCKELKRIKNEDIDDVTQIIPDMINNIKV
jgi:hypothetical protein